MSVTAEAPALVEGAAAMAMPHGNAPDALSEDHRRSEPVIKAEVAIPDRGSVARTVVDDMRQAWVFTGAPPSIAALVEQTRNPQVPGDNVLLKAGLRTWLAVAIPLSIVLYGLAWAQQHPARAVVVDGALAGLVYVWLL